jgi:DNA processing protein
MTPATKTLTTLLSRYTRQEILRGLASVSECERVSLRDALHILSERKGDARLKPRKRVLLGYEDLEANASVGYFDDTFPALLREIPDPPLVLYYRGALAALSAVTVAVVGSRRCTAVGARHAREMGASLARSGLCIASGLAVGIDGAAHRGALECGGATVAFLGSGLRQLYPTAHAQLADEIVASGGALISEYPPGWHPRPRHFPERNRLISGVSRAVIVVEASDKSGSLITARLALEQGRDVYAMPGPVSSAVSRGSHRLVQQGAGLVTSADDVLAELGVVAPSSTPIATPASARDLTPQQSSVLKLLDGYPQLLDELVVSANRNALEVAAHELSQVLVELEMAGFVETTSLGYIRTS